MLRRSGMALWAMIAMALVVYPHDSNNAPHWTQTFQCDPQWVHGEIDLVSIGKSAFLPRGAVDGHVGDLHVGAPFKQELPYRLGQTSQKLWPQTNNLQAALVQPHHEPDQHVVVPAPSTAQVLVNEWAADVTRKNFETGLGLGGVDLVRGIVQTSYGLADGVFNLNRKVDALGEHAPTWLRDLTQANQAQQAKDAETVRAALTSIPDVVAKIGNGRQWLANLEFKLPSFTGSDILAMVRAVDEEGLGRAIPTLAASTITRGRSSVWLTKKNARKFFSDEIYLYRYAKGPGITREYFSGKLSNVLYIKPVSDRFDAARDPKVKVSLRDAASNEPLLIRYPSGEGPLVRFDGRLEKGTLEVFFSAKRFNASASARTARPLTPGDDKAKVVHTQRDADILQIEDGSYAFHKVLGDAETVSAKLLNSTLLKLGRENVPVNHVQIELQQFSYSSDGLLKRLLELKGSGASASTNKAFERAIFANPLGQVARRNGFDLVDVRLGEFGEVLGVVFSRSVAQK